MVRAVVVAISSWVLRYIHRPIPFNWQAVLVWGGLRGALALAMALSLPFAISPGAAFPDRDLLQVMTFGVILFSLLAQALTMRPLLNRLGVVRATRWQEEFETIGVRKGMAAAVMAEVERLATEGDLSPEEATELRRAYAARIAALDEDLRDLHLRDEDLRREHLRSVRRRLLQLEKSVVQQRYLEGAISEEPMRELLAELDTQIHALSDAEEVQVGEAEADQAQSGYHADARAQATPGRQE
jgi:CPA1 family monovalent cation:H+ antiporter